MPLRERRVICGGRKMDQNGGYATSAPLHFGRVNQGGIKSPDTTAPTNPPKASQSAKSADTHTSTHTHTATSAKGMTKEMEVLRYELSETKPIVKPNQARPVARAIYQKKGLLFFKTDKAAVLASLPPKPT